ncbi:titin isoform X3 [Drosophila biarmipes]|uniref:titin isoform X3 n=1 Tax=Drosophila biarmipes TaxID=125945 RepID=UPI0021CC7AF5|nr:titin isoform X3 [Drosophila biarmipes]
MEDSRKQTTMGPPAPVASSPNQLSPGNASSAPAPQATRNAAAPKRIIKKIQLDFNKLKEAGLDRQLAEVLRKQKLEAKKVEAPSSSKPSPSADAKSTSAAAEMKLQSQQQQLHQPAEPEPLVKRISISEFIEKTVPIQPIPNPTEGDRSKQVKALLKNRILSKNMAIGTQPQQKPTTSKGASKMPPSAAQSSAPRSVGNPASPAAFSGPIAKADLTVRQKQPPVLLNLVNQLPKHRDLCGSSKKPSTNQKPNPEQHSAQFSIQQAPPSPQRIPVQQPPHFSPQLPPQHHLHHQPPPQVPMDQAASAATIRFHKSPSPPLIVLENKVLAPNEKIDLSGLRLPNTPVTTTVIQLKPTETPVQPTPQSKGIRGKVIMNANKFKVSKEKLAEMAKEIRSQVEQVKLPQTLKPLNSKDLTPPVETPFTISSILQRKHTPIFDPTSMEESTVPEHSPALNKVNEVSSCTGTVVAIDLLPADFLPDQSNETTDAMDHPEEEPTDFSVSGGDGTPEPEQLCGSVSETSGTLHLSEDALASSEPNQDSQMVENKSSPVKQAESVVSTLETEGVGTVSNPLVLPVYITSTPNLKKPATATKSSPLKPSSEGIQYPEQNSSVYISLTPQGGKLVDGISSESNAVVLQEPKELQQDVTTESRIIEMSVCIPLTYETDGKSSEPRNTDLTSNVSPTSKVDEISVSPSTSSSYGSVATSPVSNIKSNSQVTPPPVQKVQSAVDFIAQLTAEKDLDESSFMDLSPEEQRLNALFGGSICTFTGVSPVNKSPQPENDFTEVSPVKESSQLEDDLPIGKIVKLDDMNILHATLDVNSDSTNILRISPNAMMMQSSVATIDMSLDVEGVVDSVLEGTNVQVNMQITPGRIETEKRNPNVANEETASPDEVPTLTEESKKLKEPVEEVKSVSDPEPAKETRPVKRAPIRSKKAKINLVQRTKRPSIPKPFEAKKTKLDFEADDEQTMAVDQTLLEDRYGVAAIEVPADEKQREEEIIQCREEVAGLHEEYPNIQSEEEEVENPKLNIQEEQETITKSSTERDLTQLYHPPKMPKSKASTKSSSHEALEDSQPATSKRSVSLKEVLSQDPPLPQGEARLPFRKESNQLNSTACSSPNVTGIQHLLGHLTTEKVIPQVKKLSPTTKSEEPTKPIPRKKLVKTRPVLSKRSSKVSQKNIPESHNHFEFLHPVSASVGGRIPTSSTSDDDGSIFLGFDDKEEKRSKTPLRSKRVKQMKINETDISDDATPDYDETEEEQQSVETRGPVKNSQFDTQYTFKKHTVVEPLSDDSNSSYGAPTSPLDFGDNVSTDGNQTNEEYPMKQNTTWEELVNENSSEVANDDAVNATKEPQENSSQTAVESVIPTLDCARIEDPPKTDLSTNSSGDIIEDYPKTDLDTNLSGFTLKVSLLNNSNEHSEPKPLTVMDEKQPETLINEKDLSLGDSKLRRSRRRSLKQSLLPGIETPKEPSTSKESLTNTRATKKRMTRSRSKTPVSLENTEPSRVVDEISLSDDAHPTENLKHVENKDLKKDLEKREAIKDHAKSRGKRKTRCGNKEVTEVKTTELLSEKGAQKKEEHVKSSDERLDDGEASEKHPLAKTTSENKGNIDSTENQQEEKSTEKPVTPKKSRGKRNSRCFAPKMEVIKVIISENKDSSKGDLEEVKAAEEMKSPQKYVPTKATENRNSMVRTKDKNSFEEPDTSIKAEGNRKSRCTTPKSKVAPVIQPEAVANPELVSDNSSPKKKEDITRHTRSNTPKAQVPVVCVPAVTENESVEGPENASKAKGSQRPKRKGKSPYSRVKQSSVNSIVSELDNVTGTNNQDSEMAMATVIASEEPKEVVNPEKSSYSRSKSPKLVPHVIHTEEDLATEEITLKTDLQAKLDDEEPNQATNVLKTNKKRHSRRKTPEVRAPPVTQVEPPSKPDISPEESLTEINSTTVQAADETIQPTTSKKLRGKRQSRCASKPNSTAQEAQPAVSIPPEEPRPVEADSLVARVKRKAPSRYSLVPPDIPISSVSTSEENENLESAPKEGRRRNAATTPVQASTPKSRKSMPSNVSEMILPISEEPKVPSKRGRKRAAPDNLDSESAKKQKTEEGVETVSIVDFNLRLLLIKRREQLDTEEILTDDGKGEGPLQCGLCLARSDKINWLRHLGEHYGVGWLVGESPRKITRTSVMNMMKNYLQNSSQKLKCRLCDHQLGSYLGMMLHLEGCGNKQRLTCDYCQRSYTKLSLPSHIRTCPKRLKSGVDEETEPSEGEASEPVYSNAGRAKRKSTIKAETKLKKLGEHLGLQKPGEEGTAKIDFDGDASDYDMTKDKESSEEYDSEGVDSNEDSLSSEEEGSLADMSSTTKRKNSKRRGDIDRKRTYKRAVNLGECQQKPLLSRYHHLEARATHKWNEFVRLNYEADLLFTQLLPSFSKVSAQASALLPSKETASMGYAYGKITNEDEWKQLAPFEGFNKEGEYVGYLGHSIKKLAWVPLPSKVTNQYLVCSLRPKLKSFARHTKLKDEDALLMLLKCTVSAGKHGHKSWAIRPELHYGIRVRHGPVNSFCFLPSGGYDETSNRLGLLAVANSLSDVHIYALPLEVEKDLNAEEDVVIQPDPLIILSLDVNNPVQEQCTKICWSQSLGHNFIATGYSSGYIAFWDISEKDNINCFNRNNQTYFVPLHFFYIGERNIQFMDLHYDNNGPRWLAVGTAIRQFKIFDIANWSKPFILTQEAICNLYMANLTWSPIWETLVVSSSHFSRAIAVSVSGIQFEHRTLDGTLTTIRDMHSNCQQNHMVFVTDNGDLVFLDVRDLNCGPALLKSTVNTRAVSTSELHHLGESTPKPKEPISAEDFLRDYGVQINPLVPEPHSRKSAYLNAQRRPQNIHSLALTRSNCVRCNWNSPAHTWVAVGSEHGMLRILNFERDKFF